MKALPPSSRWMRRPSGRGPVLALLLGACTPYTGLAARGDAAPDDPEVALPVGVCGTRGVCDPVAGTGCDAGAACGLVAESVAACGPREGRATFTACNATAQCAPGSSCIALRCVRLCCHDEACGDLASSTARSRCAVKTQTEALYGCTRAGACDYLRQTGCADGQHCYPTSLHGGGNCMVTGTVPENGNCRGPSDCAWPFTCLGGPGVCRRICSTLANDCPGGAPCLRFSDRPADFGYCER